MSNNEQCRFCLQFPTGVYSRVYVSLNPFILDIKSRQKSHDLQGRYCGSITQNVSSIGVLSYLSSRVVLRHLSSGLVFLTYCKTRVNKVADLERKPSWIGELINTLRLLRRTIQGWLLFRITQFVILWVYGSVERGDHHTYTVGALVTSTTS